MSDLILSGFATMAILFLIAAVLYLPSLPHAIRNQQQKRERLDLLVAILFAFLGTAIILVWFAAAILFREMSIPYSPPIREPAFLIPVLMNLVGAGFFIRAATRMVIPPLLCWTAILGFVWVVWASFFWVLS